MKKYYIEYYRDFANTYNLYSVENEADQDALHKIAPTAKRITLKDARRKIREERWARVNDQAFGGYGDTSITPAAVALEKYDQYM